MLRQFFDSLPSHAMPVHLLPSHVPFPFKLRETQKVKLWITKTDQAIARGCSKCIQPFSSLIPETCTVVLSVLQLSTTTTHYLQQPVLQTIVCDYELLPTTTCNYQLPPTNTRNYQLPPTTEKLKKPQLFVFCIFCIFSYFVWMQGPRCAGGAATR